MFKQNQKSMLGARHWSDASLASAVNFQTKQLNDTSASSSPRDEAITILKQGVKAWNTWIAEKRKSDPEYRPDLRRLDFRDAEWRATPLWRRTDEHVRDRSTEYICLYEEQTIDHGNYLTHSIEPIDLKGAILYDAHFEKVALFKADLEQAHLEGAHFDEAYLSEANLKRANLSRTCLKQADLTLTCLERTHCGRTDFQEAFVSATNFKRAHLWSANFKKAYVGNSQFEEADCFHMNIEDAVLRGADFTRAEVSKIQYRSYRGWPLDVFPFTQSFWPFKRNLMLGKYLGIRGLDSCYGGPGFRRDALDQDFIDDKFQRVELINYHGQTIIQNRWTGWLLNSELGLRIRWLLSFPFRMRWLRIPSRLIFALWGFFDYGRSILSLLIFATLIVGSLGYWYQNLEASGAIEYASNLKKITMADGILYEFRPWFAALMGFATLGLTEIIAPHHWTGALAMVLNVLGGFATLGLFIAVFQNKFARRS